MPRATKATSTPPADLGGVLVVRMLVTLTGAHNGVYWPPVGGEVELPHHEAAKLVAAGYAEPANARAPRKRAVRVTKASDVRDWGPVSDG
ncbi:hypothetical protein EV645_5719 [Kribbella rubisoli]|uniref:Uncharacterized protein n=1 Tax=Kribbella rubisoli TaxID=3075929 RepID=A0A4Q7WSY7_9ACTN|nr:hypothetical protein [Kribbella rubisoli]RZU12449.1 hypothetical protein EV645_5719 [Kribbella rubisoli]